MKNKFIKYVIISLVSILFGFILGTKFRGENVNLNNNEVNSAPKKDILWTCSMHPQIRLHKKGKCPICFMDLIELEQKQTFFSSKVKGNEAKLETAKVIRRFPEVEVELFGKIAWDETRIKTISANFPGRIDRLYVDYTGIKIRKGDHLAKIYSPELLSVQAELATAKKFLDIKSLQASREKLRLWGFSKKKIKAIELKNKRSDKLEINSPISGIVLKKMISEGEYVETGKVLFQIADTSIVWLLLDAYESDLPWVRFGQNVEFLVEGMPGTKFKGKVTFISPELNEKTRTVKIRINSNNKEGNLKPGMFVTAKIKAKIASNQKIISHELKDKWMCPMHPEIIKKSQSTCDICGMSLLHSTNLGYIEKQKDTKPPLLIPESAPLLTGKRAVVYVENNQNGNISYSPRVVNLGPKAGSYFIVKSGLEENENVVKKGAFLLDSSRQIQGNLSMMTIKEFPSKKSKKNNFYLIENLKLYFKLQMSLAKDDIEKSINNAKELKESLKKIKIESFDESNRKDWDNFSKNILNSLNIISQTIKIEEIRVEFSNISKEFIDILSKYPIKEKIQAHLTFCSMAFDGKGGSWLQKEKKVYNPYFGAEMLHCGYIKKSF